MEEEYPRSGLNMYNITSDDAIVKYAPDENLEEISTMLSESSIPFSVIGKTGGNRPQRNPLSFETQSPEGGGSRRQSKRPDPKNQNLLWKVEWKIKDKTQGLA